MNLNYFKQYTKILFLIAFTFGFSSNVFAQDLMDVHPSLSNIKSKSIINHNNNTPIESQWDIEFNYDAFAVTGANGNAGCVYIPTIGKFWTSRWAATVGNAGVIHEWNTNGTLNATHTLTFTGTRGMCFDGTNVYHSTSSATVQVVNPVTRLVVGTISVPAAPNGFRFITYNPDGNAGAGSIIGGNWTAPNLNFYEYSLTGVLLRTITNTVTGVYGIAYDKWTAGGPYLWVWGQGAGAGTPQYFNQMDYTTGLYTGVQKDVKNDVGIGQPTGGLAGGMFITNQLVAGEVTMGGIMQGSPDLFFGYELVPSTPQGPGYAITPAPINAAIGVTTPSNTLTWINPAGATSNAVWFGTNPASLTQIHSGSLVTSVPVTGLTYSTKYFWRVDEIGATGTTTGTLWSFTTEAAPVVVVPLPYVQDFESGVFPPAGWSKTGSLWLGSDYAGGGISGYGNGLYSTLADFYEFSGTADLISLEYNSTGATAPKLTFDWAYATYVNEVDELDIYYSTNAGATWTILLAMPGGTTGILNPFNLAQTAPYIPADNEWSTMTLTLPAGTNKVKFTAVSAFGNLLWLDNIRITSTLFFDDMEAYTSPGQLACQNPTNWTTWSNAPCGNEDATISTNYAKSGTKSALIDFVTPRQVDLVYLTGTKTSGKWYMSVAIYIPAGKSGYFNTQALFGVDWGVQVYFDAGGTGTVESNTIVPFNWLEDNWNQCLVVVDLNTSTGEFWFGPNAMTQIAVWDWTQGGAQSNTLDGWDFFGSTANDQMYIDDFRFSDLAPPIILPVNEVGTLSIDMDYQYAPGTVVPKATVKNYGTATNTFDVVMTITGGYTSTKTVTALAGGATQQVTFDNWTAAFGSNEVVNVCTQLAGDEDPLDNCKNKTVTVWDESGTWTSGNGLPISTYNGIGVSYNDGTTNYLFVMGGNTWSGLRNECYKYNVTTNTWTAPGEIAPLPSGRIIAAGAVVGNFIYVIGGSDGTVYTNTVYKYDIAGNTWSTLAAAPFPITIGWCKAVSYLNRYIYVAGGYIGTGNIYQNTVYLFDTTTETWSTASPMPGDGVFGGAFGITGNTLVYAGGATVAEITNTVMVGTIVSPAVINWVTADNPYPGNGKVVRGNNDPNLLLSEMLTQSKDAGSHSVDAAVFPAGGIYRTHASTWGSDAIIMAGGTPTSDYIAANPGPCYVYKPATDTWIAQENIPIPVGAHQSGSVQDGSTWKFIIASGYGVTVRDSSTQIYTQTLGGATTFALNVGVIDGWNMVSVPGTNPSGMGVSTWWPNRNALADVFKWTTTYEPVTLTAPREGYWMLHTGAQTYNYPAIQIVAHDPIPVTAGWNIIGGYDQPIPVAGLTTTPSGQIVPGTVYGWNGTYFGILDGLVNLDPGYGYWVLLSGNAVINVPTVADGSAKLVAQDDKSEWGKITITDASGKSYTLYSVNGEVNLDQYQMPPLPPTGMFDVRYGSNRKAENLKDNNQTIEMRGLVYPVTVRAEKMDLKLQDETGKVINVNLKAGEDVVISDATIQKLKVSGEMIPTVYALEQNYPNPFNPSTKIEFSIPEDVNNVTLTIYNTLGQKVAELVNSKMEAGKYSYVWNASDVSTGLYIYELRTDKFVSVKKMMFLK